MTITGIIAEFNPFHNGHKYLLEQVEGLKIVAMSGNFVQRGEPALVDKWTRAQMALENGADIVVELPFLVSVQSADYFAQGAVDILSRLGVQQLVFGTEEVLDYAHLSELYRKNSRAMKEYVQTLPNNLSYPEKTQLMWERFAGVQFSGNTPNHILALTYAKACAETPIQLHPIQRIGQGFHSKEKAEIASATAIRQNMEDQEFVSEAVPSAEQLLTAPRVTWADYFPLLRYHILTHPDLTQIFQVNEELASRIRSAIGSAATVEDLVETVATKRYTKARVRRVLTYILVQAQEQALPEGIHVLGFSQKGRLHLKKLKESVHLISRIGKEDWDKMTQQADVVYRLGNPTLNEQTYGRVPVQIKDKD